MQWSTFKIFLALPLPFNLKVISSTYFRKRFPSSSTRFSSPYPPPILPLRPATAMAAGRPRQRFDFRFRGKLLSITNLPPSNPLRSFQTGHLIEREIQRVPRRCRIEGMLSTFC